MAGSMADFLPGGGGGGAPKVSSTPAPAAGGGGASMSDFLSGGTGTSSSASGGKIAFNSWASLPVGSPERTAMERAYVAQNQASPGGDNIVTKILSGIGGAVVHAPAGMFHLATDIGKAAVHGAAHPSILGAAGDANYFLNRTPSGKAVVQGYKQTGNEVVHPTQIAHNYSADPVGSFLNDVANLAPIAKGLGTAAEVGARSAEGANASHLAGAAGALHKASDVLNTAAAAPIAGPMKLPRLLGDAAYEKVMSAAEEGKTKGVGVNAITRNVARLGSTHNALSTANLEGAAHETQVRQAVNRVQMKVAKILPDKDEQAAWVTHLQGESPAYHLMATLMPDRFEQFVTEHTGGTLTPRAAQMAADVASGHNPELAARMEQATAAFDQGLGNTGLGSLSRMDEAYTSTPGHEWQAGFEPNPDAMATVGDRGTRAISAALKAATEARSRANEARDFADQVREGAYGKAADRAQAAQERAGEAAGAPLPVPSNRIGEVRPAGPKERIITGERARVAEASAARQGRLAHPDFLVGTASERARRLDTEATAAEANLRRTQSAAHLADLNTAADAKNAPSRLRPVLSTNTAVAHELVAQVNQLHLQGLHEAAHQLEDAIADLPMSVKELAAAEQDARYVPHTQEGKPGSNAFSPKNKQGLPGPRKPGALKAQREGSQVYDRSVAGVSKGIVDRAVYETRQATAAKIAKLPFAARLNEGPLAGIGTKEEAQAKGYEPWQPGALFDKAGNVRSLDDYEKALGLTGDTLFIPKPLFDSFRTYFEPRRGELMRAVSAPFNKAFVMTRLAFSPALITGRLVGHTVLAMAHEGHDPISTGKAVAEAYRQYKATGDRGERGFTFVPPRLPKGGTMEAEVDRLRADHEEAQARAAGRGEPTNLAQKGLRGVSKVGDMLNQAASHTLHAAAFWDNLNRSAYYLIEKGKGASEADAVRSALRATGEFDRMTPFERDYARSVVPFWAWHREITRIAAHLAEDEPVKTAWLLHLGNLDNDQNGPLQPQFDQGSISFGNTYISPGFLVPFTEAGTPFQGGLGGLGKDLGPLPRVLVGQLGINPTSGKQWYEPPGTPTRFGMPLGPSLLKQLGGLVPEVGLAGALNGSDSIDRYANGEPVLTKAHGYKPQPTGQSLRQALLSFAGISAANKEMETQKQLQSVQSAAKTAKTAAKTNKNYEARKARLSGGSTSKPAAAGGGMSAFLP